MILRGDDNTYVVMMIGLCEFAFVGMSLKAR